MADPSKNEKIEAAARFMQRKIAEACAEIGLDGHDLICLTTSIAGISFGMQAGSKEELEKMLESPSIGDLMKDQAIKAFDRVTECGCQNCAEIRRERRARMN